MNKLEDNIYQAIGLSANEQGIINQALATNKTAEITTDVAVKFAEWLQENRWFSFYDGKWNYSFEQGTSISKVTYEKNYRKTTDELFEEFINNHYGK